jgi:hypothetical protein
MCASSCVAQRRPARAARRRVFCKLCGMEQRAELLVVLGASCAHDATQMSRSIPFTSQTSTCTNSFPQLSSLSAKLCHSMSLVLNAAAASLVFDRRGVRARTLQPSAQFGFIMSQRSFELASLQWCRSPGSVTRKQHAQLVCCSCPLSMLASRLAHAVNWRESNRSFAHKAIARIMKQCFSVTARWLWYANYAPGR